MTKPPALRIPLIDAPPLTRFGYPSFEPQTSPAAGADFSFAVPGQWFVRPVAIFARLVTDANVANRELVVEYQDPQGLRFALMGAPVTVSAGSTNDYCFSSFQGQADWPEDSSILVPLYPLILPSAFIIKLHVVNVQAGDQLSRIRFFFERFSSDVPEYTGADEA